MFRYIEEYPVFHLLFNYLLLHWGNGIQEVSGLKFGLYCLTTFAKADILSIGAVFVPDSRALAFETPLPNAAFYIFIGRRNVI
jgi:hypothetical protein